MSETNQPNEVTNDRRRRVNRLKKIIIITALILIIIPIILCIVLMFKVVNLQKTVDELLAMKNNGEIVAQYDDDGKTYYVYASAIEDKEPGSIILEPQVNVPPKDETETDDTDKPGTTVEEQIDTGRYVYLTFDDGPSEQTDRIIEILAKNNVTATFFVIGREDEESIERYKKIVSSGNSIGLHSYSHDYADIYSSVEAFAEDVNKISDVVYNATGVRTKLYRFPGGSSNAIASDINIFINYLNENGYTYYDWNSSSRDAAAIIPSKDEIIDTVLSEVEGNENVVVLMHDSIKKESTVEALPELITKLKEMGYTIKGIDENSIPVQHR